MTNPYRSLPDYAFWRKSFAGVSPETVDIVLRGPITVTKETKVATAGSCFAQHVARELRRNKLNFLVTEHPHPLYSEEMIAANHYSDFSARFGNIYTARQLLQLFKRAYGTLVPMDDVWRQPDGSFVDPYRPQIQAGGFATEQEYWADRAQHFQAVRTMFETLDVLVFTLGLTETWRNRADGVVYPVCPGTAAGVFDPVKHEFYNQPFEDVVADMSEFIGLLRQVNPKSKIILTVSPVPLIATVEDRHVLLSTTYSKSVLRVAAERLTEVFEGVHYFPSYEIITGSFNRGAYFGHDLREIEASGIQHVMRLFIGHFVPSVGSSGPLAALAEPELGSETRGHRDTRSSRLDDAADRGDREGRAEARRERRLRRNARIDENGVEAVEGRADGKGKQPHRERDLSPEARRQRRLRLVARLKGSDPLSRAPDTDDSKEQRRALRGGNSAPGERRLRRLARLERSDQTRGPAQTKENSIDRALNVFCDEEVLESRD